MVLLCAFVRSYVDVVCVSFMSPVLQISLTFLFFTFYNPIHHICAYYKHECVCRKCAPSRKPPTTPAQTQTHPHTHTHTRTNTLLLLWKAQNTRQTRCGRVECAHNHTQNHLHGAFAWAQTSNAKQNSNVFTSTSIVLVVYSSFSSSRTTTRTMSTTTTTTTKRFHTQATYNTPNKCLSRNWIPWTHTSTTSVLSHHPNDNSGAPALLDVGCCSTISVGHARCLTI